MNLWRFSTHLLAASSSRTFPRSSSAVKILQLPLKGPVPVSRTAETQALSGVPTVLPVRNYKAASPSSGDQAASRPERRPLEDTLEKLLGSSSGRRPGGDEKFFPGPLGTAPGSVLSISFPLPSLPSLWKLRVKPWTQEHQYLSRPIRNLPLMGRPTTQSPASSSDNRFNCQKQKILMQIEAKLKICSSLLLVPRVPFWGIFKWLSSSEAKEERGDRWSHAFLQRFLRTVLVESPSAHPCCSGEVSSHDLLLLKIFLPAPDSPGTDLRGLICTAAFRRDASHTTDSEKSKACLPKNRLPTA